MMKRTVVSLICTSLMLGVASMAQAGAYGEEEETYESPAPAPAPRRPTRRVERRERVSDFARSGPYLQVGGVYAFENIDADVFVSGFPAPPGGEFVGGNWDDSWGYEIRGGYRVNPWVAVELEWEHYLDFDFDSASGYPGTRSVGKDLESYILTANGKVYPVHGRFQPYALIGMGWQNGQMERSQLAPGGTDDFDHDALAFRFGAGLDVYFTDMIGMAAEAGYVLPVTGELSDQDFEIIPVSLSFFVRFL